MSQLASDLLAQAEALAKADQQRPKSANLRRSVSSAYYALFHHLIDEGGQLIAGTANQDRPLVVLTTRAFSHADMKAACQEFSKTPPKEIFSSLWSIHSIPADADLRIVAHALINLQKQRHSADYDLTTSFSRADALAAVVAARCAIDAWNRLKRHRRPVARLAVLTMLLWKNLQGRQ